VVVVLRKLLRSLALLGGHCVKAIPWFKQILKVFVCGLADHNGLILKIWGDNGRLA
jgi:hypothetical protein